MESLTEKQKNADLEIFQFTDYRSFLQAYFSDRKKNHKLWTYGVWAKKLGLKNSTSILKVLNGSREAGPEITEKLVSYFRFNEKERRYFEDLIRLSKVTHDPARKMAIMDRLRLQHPKRKFTLLDDKSFAAISRWWFYGIRQLTKLKVFRLDPDWIAARFRFKVSAKEISHALKTMEELGLIKITQESALSLVLTEKSLNTTDDVSNEALKRFHEEVLTLAHASVRATPVAERQISGLTLAVKTEDLPRMKAFLRKMEDEFAVEFEAPKEGDQVYQLETALFPLTKFSKEIAKEKKEEGDHT
jgi:uncharacterized protein (TIGR02147 family)